MTTQYTIHIPQSFNDGRIVPEITIKEFLSLALERFGGYTLDPNSYMGGWKDESTGKIYEERVFKLEVATASENAIKDFAYHIGSALKQECVYVLKGGAVDFVNTDDWKEVA